MDNMASTSFLPLLFGSTVAAVFFYVIFKKRYQHTPKPLQKRILSPNEPSCRKLLRTGVWEAQGKRDNMEDAHTINVNFSAKDDESNVCGFLGVYDGHGGRKAADYVALHLPEIFIQQKNYFTNPEDAIRLAIEKVEKDFLDISREQSISDGTTLVVTVLIDNHLTIANVGDSECILASDGKGIPLSEIHNPSKNDSEIERVEGAGGRIFRKRVGHPLLNVNYFNIGLSRAIGDDMYKNPKYTEGKISGLTADPFIQTIELDLERDDFLIIACDGLWDVFTYQEAVHFVEKQLKLTEDLNEVSKNLVNEALRKGSLDNVSVIIATWKQFICS